MRLNTYPMDRPVCPLTIGSCEFIILLFVVVGLKQTRVYVPSLSIGNVHFQFLGCWMVFFIFIQLGFLVKFFVR